ncbi:MAG: cupin domain-containing protein [Planctomycetes bacterium]|nr:cupin domain-containing protein [Planctomycetota bacterium]
MGKTTLFESPRLLIGLNAFEPGQEHAPHAHAGADKVYYVLEGEGEFTLNDTKVRLRAGQMLAAPAGEPHGVRNDTDKRLLVMAAIAPGPALM